MPGGNVGGNRFKVEKTHFDTLETLPKRLREAIANAPYPFAVTEIAVYLERLKGGGMDPEEATDLILSRFKTMIARRTTEEVLKNYGPEHPQAKLHD